MQMDVLGPLQATVSGRPAGIARGRSSATLAWLVLRANDWVDLGQLAEETGTRSSNGGVARLRMVLRGLMSVLDDGALELRPSRVRLILPDDAVDAARFERLIQEARGFTGSTAGGMDRDSARAHASLVAALELWRGEPYADLDRPVAAVGEIERLVEMRMTALEELIGLALAEPVDYPTVAELQAMVTLHPDRARFRRQLAQALYRTGRQIESLEVLRDARREIGDETGLADELHSAILRHDPGLETGEL